MRKRIDRKKLMLIFSIFFVSIISLSVVYAALSTTLRISGSSEVVASSWNITIERDVVFTNLYDYFKDDFSNGGVLTKEAVIDGTTIKDYQVSLTKPGDGVIQFFKVTNTGTIPAVFSSLTHSNPSCASSSGNTIEADYVCGSVQFLTLIGEEASPHIDGIYEKFILEPGDSTYVGVGIIFSPYTSAVVSSNVVMSNLKNEILFEQCVDKECSNSIGEIDDGER